MEASAIIKSIESVTKKWTKQRKAEERGRTQSRRDALIRLYRVSIKDAACRVMADAYSKASDGGRLPVAARQLYYAGRGPIMEATQRTELNSQYFTQTILPEYTACHQEETSDWDITYDARGHFAEPHTGIITPLGTLDVRQYLATVRDHVIKPLDASRLLAHKITRFPTCGPEHRFSAVLFIEKEGFMPLFAAVKLAERFDIAIMSTKGMPVVACRHLADELCGKHGIPLMVLHDFDKAGFSIAGTLAGVDHYDQNYNERTTRYDYRHNFNVIDLGLRLADVRAYNLESEPVQYRSDPTSNLKENGAMPEEVKFLCATPRSYRPVGRRVELNAFTSADFIRWIEAKLQANGIKKVIPDTETLAVAYRRALQVEIVRDQLDAIVQQAGESAQRTKLPANLDRVVGKALNADPTQPWDQAVAVIAAANCKKRDGQKPGKQAKSNAPADVAFTNPAPPAKKRSGERPRKKEAAPATLEELGMSDRLARQCRAVAEFPAEWLEEYVKATSGTDGEVTTEGFLAFCKKRKNRKTDLACSKSATEDV